MDAGSYSSIDWAKSSDWHTSGRIVTTRWYIDSRVNTSVWHSTSGRSSSS